MKKLSAEDEDEFERTARAAHISRPRGRVDVAIDFSNEIFGFPNHKTRYPIIYACDDYAIWSDISSVPASLHDLHTPSDIYNARHLHIEYPGTSEFVLLETAARDWFMSYDRTLSDFSSKNFLTQTFITHTILRLQQHTNAMEPWKDLLRRYAEEDSGLLNRFLEVLQPRILSASQQCFREWGEVIDQGSIYSRALTLTRALAFGDTKDDFLQSSTNENRGESLHPYKKRLNSKKETVEGTRRENLDFWQKFFTSSLATNSDVAETLLLLRVNTDAETAWLTSSLNQNSARVYHPDSAVSLLQFVFGMGTRRSNLARYLRDTLRTERNRVNKHSQFDESLSKDDLVPRAVRWKKNDTSRFSQQQIIELRQAATSCLKGINRRTFLDYLASKHNPRDPSSRQRLSRAKRRLKTMRPDLPL